MVSNEKAPTGEVFFLGSKKRGRRPIAGKRRAISVVNAAEKNDVMLWRLLAARSLSAKMLFVAQSIILSGIVRP